MAKKKLSLSAATAQKHVKSSVEAWLKENTPTKIRSKVFDRLDKKLNDTIMTLLGFDNGFGRWEVRKENSEIMNKIHELAGPEVDRWLEKAFEKATIPKNGSVEKLIMEEFRKVFQEQIRRRVRDAAKAKAEELVEHLVKDLTLQELETLGEEATDDAKEQAEKERNDLFGLPKLDVRRR